MKQILILLSLGFLLSASAEQFAVVQGEYVDLMSSQGELKYRLQRGEVVKVKNHKFDNSFYFVSVGPKSFTAPKNSFREVSSIFQEEKRLLSQIDKNHETISVLEKEATKLIEQKNILSKKITELQIWIEVQRDLSYSRDFFKQKTKGSFIELKKLKGKAVEKDREIKSYLEKISTEKSLLKAFEQSFEILQTKLKTLKNERAFYQRNFVEVEVIASETPVFFNGKIVEYLNTHTKIKVKKDRNLNGWYVFFKNKKAHYISSKDVMVSQS
ncbi:MAG: hypothetical protein NE328_07210 [Lentisphaeraceae bacterium]|nr:hypothetical protein [Lentisphaeraceae bacterium]